MDNGFWTFQIPNIVLAALMYTMIGRIILSFLFRARPDAVIVKVFSQVTNPVARVVRLVTPRLVPDPLVLVLSVFWLLAARMVLFLVTALLGVAPTAAG